MSILLDGTLGTTTPAETVQGALTTTGNTILGDASTDTLNVGNGSIVTDGAGNTGFNGTATNYGATYRGIWLNAPGVPIMDFAVNGTRTLSVLATSTTPTIKTVTNTPLIFGTNDTEQARIDSTGLFKFNSGYGSVATAYGCRAWVNFNGQGVVAIQASGNVSSITDNGVGDYTVNFTTAMVDANYAFSYACQYNHTGVATIQNIFPMMKDGLNMRSTTSLRFWTGTASTTTYDCAVITASIFR